MTCPTSCGSLTAVSGTAVQSEARRRAREELDEVVVWRIEQLHRAGYDPDSVIALALARDVDLHLAVELRRRGCPAETALRILL